MFYCCILRFILKILKLYLEIKNNSLYTHRYNLTNWLEVFPKTQKERKLLTFIYKLN